MVTCFGGHKCLEIHVIRCTLNVDKRQRIAYSLNYISLNSRVSACARFSYAARFGANAFASLIRGVKRILYDSPCLYFSPKAIVIKLTGRVRAHFMMLTEASACIWFNRGHLAPCVLTTAIDFKNKSISILHFESI